MGKASNRKKVVQAAKRSRPAYLENLAESLAFLRASSRSYDEGFEAEAKRLAVTLRVLLHDTAASHSLLKQLGVKEKMRYTDPTIHEPPGTVNLMGSLGLVMLKLTSGVGGEYVPVLEKLLPERINPPIVFSEWWDTNIPMGSDGMWSRGEFVRALANNEGGAHVDPSLNDRYEALVRRNSLGFTTGKGTDSWPVAGSPVAASVRQIAYEFLDTVERNSDLLE